VTWASANTGVATIGAPAGLASGSAVGTSSISATLNTLSGSTLLGVTPLSLCDINGAGRYTVIDVQLMINQALGMSPPVNDLNGDGVVNVAEVQVVLNAAMNQGCTPQTAGTVARR
jgi:hypothetical protein